MRIICKGILHGSKSRLESVLANQSIESAFSVAELTSIIEVDACHCLLHQFNECRVSIRVVDDDLWIAVSSKLLSLHCFRVLLGNSFLEVTFLSLGLLLLGSVHLLVSVLLMR